MKNTENFIVTDRLMDFVKECEGLRTEAYRCPGGVWTVGYGHTGSDVRAGTKVTPEEASRLLHDDLQRTGNAIMALAKRNSCQLTQPQTDALTSLAFNIGVNALSNSTLWKKACANPLDPSIEHEFNRWVHSKGKKLQGLIKRRQREYEMYNHK